MKRSFGILPDGREAFLYTITGGGLSAEISDYGATLWSLLVPDEQGDVADVVLGFQDVNGHRTSTTYFGATVGRNANRIGGAQFVLNGQTYNLPANDNGRNNLHSAPDSYAFRLWDVVAHKHNSITFGLHSPDGDQGFPGNADIEVTYRLEDGGVLKIVYDAQCDQDTVFNLTNHTYFNLAGHDHPERAMEQTLQMNATFFTVADAESIPTGENRSVEGTPMDFRTAKPIGRDLGVEYEPLKLQGGYDHNFEACGNPIATLHDPASGRTMEVETDLPGVQFYSGNFLVGEIGKEGVSYCYRGGIALETQYYPDSVNHPEWPQPFVKAGQPYHTETRYIFK